MLRDIRAEAQNLRVSIKKILENASSEDKNSRSDVKAAFSEAAKLFAINRVQITGLIAEVSSLLRRAPNLYDWWGDETKHVENAWERAELSWPGTSVAPDEMTRRVQISDNALREVIYHCGLVTIPWRANQHVQEVRIGKALDFNATFRDEVGDEEDRVRILQYMHDHPKSVYGLVDVGNGLIYPFEMNTRKRYLGYIGLGLIVIVGVALVYVFSNLGSWARLQDWPVTPERLGELLVAYLFVLLGGFAHILVDAIKQARSSKGTQLIALGEIALWIHIKQTSILMGIASLWIGLLGLAFTVDRVDWQLAFFVGFSIDSVVDIFLQRFGEAASTGVEEAEKRIRQTST